MTNRILLTGAAGFVGPHLLGALDTMEPRPELFAWYLGGEHPSGTDASWSQVDILDPESVQASLRAIRPSHLVHLAAISNVAESFANPRATWQVNVIGTLNVLESVKRESPETRVLLVSSSEVYGQSFSRGIPLNEHAETRPMNPYAASKLAAEVLTGPYCQRGMRLLIARPFNHIGPGQAAGFAIPSFANQLAEISLGRRKPHISVGNLEAQRDFLHVADVVGAYRALLIAFDDLPTGSVFNVCSGMPRRVREVLDELIAISGLSVKITQNPGRMRPTDIPAAIGDASRLRECTGWRPAIEWSTALRECLDDAKAQLKAKSS